MLDQRQHARQAGEGMSRPGRVHEVVRHDAGMVRRHAMTGQHIDRQLARICET